MQCCLKPLRQHCIGFWPALCYHRSIKTTLDGIFSHAMLSGASWTILHRVFSCADVVPTVLRQQCTRLFLMHCCLELFGQHCIEFWSAQCCPKSIKAKLYRTFFMQCCLEPLGQHCIGFLPAQCCPKSIKTTLNRSFSYPMLSGATQTTFHRILTCTVLSQEY